MKKRRRQARLPKGWTLKDVEDVCKYYDSQTEEEGAAEIEEMLKEGISTYMTVPDELVPQVRKMIAEYEARTRKVGRRKVARKVRGR